MNLAFLCNTVFIKQKRKRIQFLTHSRYSKKVSLKHHSFKKLLTKVCRKVHYAVMHTLKGLNLKVLWHDIFDLFFLFLRTYILVFSSTHMFLFSCFLIKTILAYLSGAQMGLIHEKQNIKKSCDTNPLINKLTH